MSIEGFQAEGARENEVPYEVERFLMRLERASSSDEFHKAIETFNKSHDFHQGEPIREVKRTFANGYDVTITFYGNTIEITGGRTPDVQQEAA